MQSLKSNQHFLLKVQESAGQEGVIRLSFYLNDINIGSARILGTTLGDINVKMRFRRKGYGMDILKNLESRGATSAYVVSEAGKALFKKAGWVDQVDGRWEKKPCP